MGLNIGSGRKSSHVGEDVKRGKICMWMEAGEETQCSGLSMRRRGSRVDWVLERTPGVQLGHSPSETPGWPLNLCSGRNLPIYTTKTWLFRSSEIFQDS